MFAFLSPFFFTQAVISQDLFSTETQGEKTKKKIQGGLREKKQYPNIPEAEN